MSSNASEILDFLRDSVIGIMCILLLVLLLYIVVFWQSLITAKIFAFVFNLRYAASHQFIKIKNMQINIFTLKLHFQKVLYANSQFSVEIGDLLIKYHFLKHIQIVSRSIFQQALGGAIDQHSIPKAPLMVKLSGIDIHIYSRKPHDATATETAKQRPVVSQIPLFFQLVPAFNVQIRGLRVTVQNEFLRLALVFQVEQIAGILGLADAASLLDQYQITGALNVDRASAALYENRGFYQHQRDVARERKDATHHTTQAQHKFDSHLLNNKFCVKFQIFEAEKLQIRFSRDVGALFRPEHLDQNYQDDNAPVFHITVKLCERERGYCGSLNFGAWYLNEILVFVDFLLPHDFSSNITTSQVGARRYATSFQVAAIFAQEFPVCMPYYNELLSYAPKKGDLLMAWKTALAENMEYYNQIEHQQLQNDAAGANMDDDIQYKLLQKLFGKKHRLSKNTSIHYINYQRALPGDIIAEKQDIMCPHPNEYNQYINYIGLTVSANSTFIFRKQFKFKHESQVVKNGITLLLKSAMVKIKASTLKIVSVAASDVQFMITNSTVFLTQPRQTMEIALLMRDLMLDLSKPLLDAILHYVNSYTRPNTIQSYYQMYDFYLPVCKVDPSYLYRKFNRLVYFAVINAQISSNVQEQHVLEQLQHVTQVSPTQTFQQRAGLFADWVALYDFNRQYLQMFTSVQLPFISQLFQDPRIAKEQVPQFDIFAQTEHLSIQFFKTKYHAIFNEFEVYATDITQSGQASTWKAGGSVSLYPRLVFQANRVEFDIVMQRERYVNLDQVKSILDKYVSADIGIQPVTGFQYELSLDLKASGVSMILQFAQSSELHDLFFKTQRIQEDIVIGQMPQLALGLSNASPLQVIQYQQQHLLHINLRLSEPVILADTLTIQVIIGFIYNQFLEYSYPLNINDICRYVGPNCLLDLLKHNSAAVQQGQTQARLSVSMQNDISMDERTNEQSMSDLVKKDCVQFDLVVDNPLLLVKQIPIGQIGGDARNTFRDSQYYALNCGRILLTVVTTAEETLVDCSISPIALYESIHSCDIVHSFKTQVYSTQEMRQEQYFSLDSVFYQSQQDQHQSCKNSRLLSIAFIDFKISGIKISVQQVLSTAALQLDFDVGKIQISMQNEQLPRVIQVLENNLVHFGYNRYYSRSAGDMQRYIEQLYENRALFLCPGILQTYLKRAKFLVLHVKHDRICFLLEKQTPNEMLSIRVVLPDSQLQMQMNCQENACLLLHCAENLEICIASHDGQQAEQLLNTSFRVQVDVQNAIQGLYVNSQWKLQQLQNSYYVPHFQQPASAKHRHFVYFFPRIYANAVQIPGQFQMASCRTDISDTFYYQQLQKQRVANITTDSVNDGAQIVVAVKMSFDGLSVHPKSVYAIQQLFQYIRQCNNVFEMTHIFFNFKPDDYQLLQQYQDFETLIRQPLSERIETQEALSIKDINLIESNSLRETAQDARELELVLQKSIHFGGNYFESRLAPPIVHSQTKSLAITLVVDNFSIALESYSQVTSLQITQLHANYVQKNLIKHVDTDFADLLIKGGDIDFQKCKKKAQKSKLLSREAVLDMRGLETNNDLLKCNHIYLHVQQQPQKSSVKQQAGLEVYVSELACFLSTHTLAGIREVIWDLKHSMIEQNAPMRQYNKKIDAALSSYVFQKNMTAYLFKQYLDLCLDYDQARNAQFVKNLFNSSAGYYQQQHGEQLEPIYSKNFNQVVKIFEEFGIATRNTQKQDNKFMLDFANGYLQIDYQQSGVSFAFLTRNQSSGQNFVKLGILKAKMCLLNGPDGVVVVEAAIQLQTPQAFVTDQLIVDMQQYIQQSRFDSCVSNIDELDKAREQSTRYQMHNQIVQERSYKQEILVLLKENQLSLGRKLLKIINYCNIQLVCRLDNISCAFQIEQTNFSISMPHFYFSMSSASYAVYPQIINKLEIPEIIGRINDCEKQVGGFSLININLQTQSKIYDNLLKTYVVLAIESMQYDLTNFNELFEQFIVVLTFCYNITRQAKKNSISSKANLSLSNIPQFCLSISIGEIGVQTTILYQNKLIFRFQKIVVMLDALQNYFEHPMLLFCTVLNSRFQFNLVTIDLPRLLVRADSNRNLKMQAGIYVDVPDIYVPIDIIAILSSLQVFVYKYKLAMTKLQANNSTLELKARSELQRQVQTERQIYLQTSQLNIKIGIDKCYFTLLSMPITCRFCFESNSLFSTFKIQKLLLIQTDELDISQFGTELSVACQIVDVEGNPTIMLQDKTPAHLFLEAGADISISKRLDESAEIIAQSDNPHAIACLGLLYSTQQLCSYFLFIKQSTSDEQQKSIDAIRVQLKQLESPKNVKNSLDKYQFLIGNMNLGFWISTITHLDFVLPYALFTFKQQTKMQCKTGKYYFLNSFQIEVFAKNIALQITDDGADDSTSSLSINVKYRLSAVQQAKQKYQYQQDVYLEQLSLKLATCVAQQIYQTVLQLTRSTSVTPLLDQKIINNYQYSQCESNSSVEEENQFYIYFQQADFTKLTTNLQIQAFNIEFLISDVIPIDFPEIQLQFTQEKRPYGRIQDYQTQEQYDGLMDLAEQFNISCFIFYQPFQSISNVFVKSHDIQIIVPYSVFEFAQMAVNKIHIADNYRQSRVEAPKQTYSFSNVYVNGMKQLQKELRKAYGNQIIIQWLFCVENAMFALRAMPSALQQYRDVLPTFTFKLKQMRMSYVKTNQDFHLILQIQRVLAFVAECRNLEAFNQYYASIDEYPLFVLPGYVQLQQILLELGCDTAKQAQKTIARHLQVDAISAQCSPLFIQLFSRFYYLTKQYINSIAGHLKKEGTEKKIIKTQIGKTQRATHLAYLLSVREFTVVVLSSAFSEEISQFQFLGTQQQTLQQFIKLKQTAQQRLPFVKFSSIAAQPFITAFAQFTNQYVEQLNFNIAGFKIVFQEQNSQMILQVASTLVYVENYVMGMLLLVQCQHIAVKHFENGRLLLELFLQNQSAKFETVGQENIVNCSLGDMDGKIAISIIQVVTRLLQSKMIEYKQHWTAGNDILTETGTLQSVRSRIENQNLSIEELKMQLKQNHNVQTPKADFPASPAVSHALCNSIIRMFRQRGQLRLNFVIPVLQLQLTQYSLEDIIMINLQLKQTLLNVRSEVNEIGSEQTDKVDFQQFKQSFNLLNNKIELVLQAVIPSLRIEMLQVDQALRKTRVTDVLKLNNALYNVQGTNFLSVLLEKQQLLLNQELSIHAEPGQIATGENLLIASQMIQTLIKDVITFIQAFQKQATSAQLFSKLHKKQAKLIDGKHIIEECSNGVFLRAAAFKNIEQLVPTLDIMGKCSGFIDMFTKNVKSIQNGIENSLLEIDTQFVSLAAKCAQLGDLLSLGFQ